MSKVIAISCDTEFTSWDKIGGDILSTAFVEILEGHKLGREVVFYSAPTSTKYFSKKAEEVHGFSYFKAQTFPSRRESCISMLQWLKPIINDFPLPFLFWGNGDLDHGWIEAHFQKEELQGSILKAFPKNKVESVLKLAKKNIKGLENYKLSTVAKHYTLDLDHHEALSDARVNAQIWCNIMLKKGTWTGELF